MTKGITMETIATKDPYSRQKKWRKANAELLNARHICDICGYSYKHNNRWNHQHTQRHLYAAELKRLKEELEKAKTQ